MVILALLPFLSSVLSQTCDDPPQLIRGTQWYKIANLNLYNGICPNVLNVDEDQVSVDNESACIKRCEGMNRTTHCSDSAVYRSSTTDCWCRRFVWFVVPLYEGKSRLGCESDQSVGWSVLFTNSSSCPLPGNYPLQNGICPFDRKYVGLCNTCATASPTASPTAAPTAPTAAPTAAPSTHAPSTHAPSSTPTTAPTLGNLNQLAITALGGGAGQGTGVTEQSNNSTLLAEVILFVQYPQQCVVTLTTDHPSRGQVQPNQVTLVADDFDCHRTEKRPQSLKLTCLQYVARREVTVKGLNDCEYPSGDTYFSVDGATSLTLPTPRALAASLNVTHLDSPWLAVTGITPPTLPKEGGTVLVTARGGSGGQLGGSNLSSVAAEFLVDGAEVVHQGTSILPQYNLVTFNLSVMPLNSSSGRLAWANQYHGLRIFNDQGELTGKCGVGGQCDSCSGESQLYILNACSVNLREDGDACLPCPPGGCCPGGTRVWAQPGYWSSSESALPAKCTGGTEACPYGAVSAPCKGGKPPQKCGQGYTGPLCGDCAPDHFHRFQVYCTPCSAGGQQREQAVLLLVLVIVLLIMGLGCLLLPSAKLDKLMVGLFKMQIIGQVAMSIVTDLPSQARGLAYLALVNLDLQALRPECWQREDLQETGTHTNSSWLFTLFWMALLLLVSFGVLLVGAACFRSVWKFKELKKEGQLGDTSLWKLFKHRSIRTTIALLYFWYQRVAFYSLDVMHCREVDGSYRLAKDPSYTCFTADHMKSFVPALLILVFYTGGFPIFSFFIIRKHKYNLTSRHMEKWGFLTRGLANHACYFRLFFFVTSICLALSFTLFTRIPTFNIFLSLLCFLFDFVFVLLWRPFTNSGEHYRTLTVGMLHFFFLSILMFTVVGEHGSQNVGSAADHALFALAIILLLLALATVAFKGQLRAFLVSKRCCGISTTANEDPERKGGGPINEPNYDNVVEMSELYGNGHPLQRTNNPMAKSQRESARSGAGMTELY